MILDRRMALWEVTVIKQEEDKSQNKGSDVG